MIDNTVRRWMTPNPITATEHETLLTAVGRMEAAHIRHLPVVANDGSLLGLVTKNDLRRAELEMSVLYKGSNVSPLVSQLRTLGEITLPDRLVLDPEDPISEAARLMLSDKVTGIPVIEDGQLVGIITESDLFGFLVESYTPEKG